MNSHRTHRLLQTDEGMTGGAGKKRFEKADDLTSKQLVHLHSRHFENYAQLKDNQFEYRRALYQFLVEATAAQIDVLDALNFHKNSVYPEVMKRHIDCTGGQAPGVIIFSNSSEDFTFEIFSSGIERVDGKKRLVDGAFGGAINIRKEKHLNQTSDYISSAYMNGHMIDHDKSVPYVLFTCAYGKRQAESGTPERDIIELAQKRREKYISEWKNAGFFIGVDGKGKTPYHLIHTHGKNERMYLPIVLHDLRSCKYFVVENGERLSLEDWAKEYGLENDKIVREHIKNAKAHEAEAGYFEELTCMTRTKKGMHCVDSRCKRSDSSTIKDLGAIATEDQRKRILNTPDLMQITVSLHFNCGYLQTAMGIHEAGMELKRLFDSGISHGKEIQVELARNYLKWGVDQTLAGEWKGFDLNVFNEMLREISGKEVTKTTAHLLKELLKSQFSDTRNTAQHMIERGMLSWSEELGTIVMPSATELDKILGPSSRLLPSNRSSDETKAKEQQKAYYAQITLIEAKKQKDIWQATANDLGKDIKIKVQIEDFENSQVVSTEDGRNLRDAVTMQEI